MHLYIRGCMNLSFVFPCTRTLENILSSSESNRGECKAGASEGDGGRNKIEKKQSHHDTIFYSRIVQGWKII